MDNHVIDECIKRSNKLNSKKESSIKCKVTGLDCSQCNGPGPCESRDISLVKEKFKNRIDEHESQPHAIVKKTESTIKFLAEEIAEVVAKKNNDYGQAFDKGVDEYGWYEYLVMLGHKYSRLKSLTVEKNDMLVADEKISDTLRDIIGYSLLMLRYTLEKKEKEDGDC